MIGKSENYVKRILKIMNMIVRLVRSVRSVDALERSDARYARTLGTLGETLVAALYYLRGLWALTPYPEFSHWHRYRSSDAHGATTREL